MANEKSFEVGGLQFTAIRQQRPIQHWVIRIDESGEVLQAGAGGISTESVPKMQTSVQELFDRVSKKDESDFRKRFGLPLIKSEEQKDVQIKFEVTFEATGVTNHPSILDNVFSEEEARGFTEASLAEKSLPKGVCAVKSGYISSDDNQGKTDIHVLTGVVLVVEVETEGAAEQFVPPEDLLTRIADLIGSEEGECKLDLESHSWEVTDVSSAQEDAQAMTV